MEACGQPVASVCPPRGHGRPERPLLVGGTGTHTQTDLRPSWPLRPPPVGTETLPARGACTLKEET